MRGPRSVIADPRRNGSRFGRVLAAVVLVTVVTAAVACGDSDPPEPPVSADGDVDPVLAEGAQIYSARCAACHAADGGGGRGPQLADGRMPDRYPDIEDQIAVVANGREAMPGFEDDLTAAEIEAVVRYTREVL